MKKLRYLFVLLAGGLFAQQDLKTNFIPLKSTGQLPDIFTQNIRNVIKQDITDLNSKKEKDAHLKSSFLTASNYHIQKIVRSGNTLVNDEITVYLNKIADVILQDNPTLRNQLHIFTLKSPVVNAYSFDKGYIFVDIGLIAQAETESQLAYILCHEISHYTKQHHINSYLHNALIDRNNYNGDRESKLIEKCQYSKENESEADLEGFRLFERTRYNLKQAEKAFDVLQYAHLPFELVELKKTFLESPNYVIPDNYFLKEVSGIRDNSNEDDTRMTHPNTKKRKEAISTLIASRDNSGRVNAIVSSQEFEYIRDLARMELCRLYLKKRDYPQALYGAYILSGKYPNNEYLAEVIAKSLYALALHGNNDISYNSDSYLSNGLPSYTEVESYPQQLYHLINKMPSNEWTIMSLNYVYRSHKKHSSNRTIASCSDSLFALMKKTNWGINEFARTLKKPDEEVKPDTVKKEPEESTSKTDLIAALQKVKHASNDDTVYYKNVFADLFSGDKEFGDKFPASNNNLGGGETKVFTLSGSKSSSSVKKENKKDQFTVDKVLLLEPFYVKIDETKREEIQYLDSDEKQGNFIQNVRRCADMVKLDLVTVDPGLIKAAEVDKVNDYSVINDWFDERFDSDLERAPILNTNEINRVIEKYGTRYVLKTGVATVVTVSGKKKTYFYGFLFDIKNNELVYRKYDYFKTKDRTDLINAKTYQLLYELKRPITKK